MHLAVFTVCSHNNCTHNKTGCLTSENQQQYSLVAVIAVVTVRTGKGKDKGKAIPLQAWTGPEGPRRLRLPDFKTIGT